VPQACPVALHSQQRLQGPCPGLTSRLLALVSSATEETAHGGPCGQARELRERTGELQGQRERGIPACLELGALPGHGVLDRAARDGSRPVAANLDDEARDDRRLFGELARTLALD
jgi:hypothetical protein